MEKGNRELLVKGASHFGIQLEEKMAEAFNLYLRELLKWNEKMNLTAIRTEKGIILKHFLDSLAVLPHLLKISSLLDIGSGAGFPGIPLKMVCPHLEVTLIDSVQKKIDFQKHIIRTLGLKGITAIHGRAQDTQVLHALRGRFDGVIARAFSDLDTLLLLGSPFLKKGGALFAMKGREIDFFSPTEKSPYRFQRMVQFTLPFSSINRSVLFFEKI